MINTLFDHTSIIKTAASKWGLPHLTERDKAATDLCGILTRETPRNDFPIVKPRPFKRAGRVAVENERLSEFQRAFLMVVAGFEGLKAIEQDQTVEKKIAELLRLIEEEGAIDKLQTVGDAIHFIRKHLEFPPAQA